MTHTARSFDLVDEPWLPVQRSDSTVDVLSLRRLFAEAGQIRELRGDLPSQDFALIRLLLAIIYRAVPVDDATWAQWWTAGELPTEAIDDYLVQWRDRFDLFDDERPFYQVATLATAKGEFTELARLLADAPTGHQFLTVRLAGGLETLTFAEAARWVVHCQAFDVSGIKSGAVGDDRVKGGKGYPIGVGAAGHLGGLIIEGDTLAQTLLLNLVPQHAEADQADRATWERDSADNAAARHPEVDGRPHRPAGIAELFTWQSRRIRLVADDAAVREVLICNGDRFSPLNLRQVESMTAWRHNEPQSKKLGGSEAWMPVAHRPGRQLWRGLESLLGQSDGTPTRLASATVNRLATIAQRELVEDDLNPTIRAIGVEYIKKSSIVGEIVDDRLTVPVRVVRRDHRSLYRAAVDAAHDADRAVEQYARLRINLVRAAGGKHEAGPIRESAQVEGFGALDEPFIAWLEGLANTELTSSEARNRWNQTACRVMLHLGETAISRSGPRAWSGRPVDGKHLTAGRAEAWYRQGVFSLFPTINEREST